MARLRNYVAGKFALIYGGGGELVYKSGCDAHTQKSAFVVWVMYL